jgi:hypothetical protein
MTDQATASTSTVSGGLPGTLLLRVVVPLWVLAGATVKLVTFNPALLPEPILDLVRQSGSLLGIENLNWWLGTWLRFFVAVEIVAAIVMIAVPRLARFTASFLLMVFLAVLMATMVMSAQRDGVSAIWSGSCGCFGSASPPPIGMFAMDLGLLLGVVFLQPRRTGSEGWRFGVVACAVIAGFGIAFGRPQPVITIEVEDTDSESMASDVVEFEASPVPGWGDIPTEVEPFYAPEFGDWVGKPLSADPLARLISRPLPTWIDTDRFHVVLYRADCDHCHTLLEDHFSGPLETPVLAVEVPDTDPASALPMPCEECLLHALPEGPNYVFATPILLTIERGMVVAVCENADDESLVVRTIQARGD